MLQWRVWWGHVEGAAQGTPGGGAQRHDMGGAPDFFLLPRAPNSRHYPDFSLKELQ